MKAGSGGEGDACLSIYICGYRLKKKKKVNLKGSSLFPKTMRLNQIKPVILTVTLSHPLACSSWTKSDVSDKLFISTNYSTPGE